MIYSQKYNNYTFLAPNPVLRSNVLGRAHGAARQAIFFFLKKSKQKKTKT